MKYLIVFLYTCNVYANWDCSTIESSMNIVSSKECGEVKYCVGYANCNSPKGKFSGRIICKANSKNICPDANECLEQAFSGQEISIGLQPEKNPRGVYRFCNSDKVFKPIRTNSIDVVNSRFCDAVSGEYDKGRQETISTMTGKEGGGGQMTTAK